VFSVTPSSPLSIESTALSRRLAVVALGESSRALPLRSIRDAMQKRRASASGVGVE
jgi:hypothetical protein